MTKRFLKTLMAISFIVIIIIPITHYLITEHQPINELDNLPDDFFFGLSFGQKTVEEAKQFIDKVKDYSNFFLINSYDISTNQTALNKVCNYASESDMYFMVFFDFVSRIGYPWHQTWLDTAKDSWGEKFLGVYLFDEPGGNQVDLGRWREGSEHAFYNVTDYNEAANRFVQSIASTNSTIDVKNRSIPMFTSDYALYWFGYQAGYDTIFFEIGWNHSIPKHLGLCRGAANLQEKEWGAIITWTYTNPPYIASRDQILEEMKIAYNAGSKYVIIFDWAVDAQTDEPYSTLKEEHYQAMQEFYEYAVKNPDKHGKIKGEVAFVLPQNYGWGFRSQEDLIWGLWGPDEKSPIIWNNLDYVIKKYDLSIDIVYEDEMYNLGNKYSKVYYWDFQSE